MGILSCGVLCVAWVGRWKFVGDQYRDFFGDFFGDFFSDFAVCGCWEGWVVRKLQKKGGRFF